MNFLEIHRYTGKSARNVAVAANLNRKLRATERLGICTLVDWSGVAHINQSFVRVLTFGLHPAWTRLGGLPAKWQNDVPPGFVLPPPPPGC
jgi:hypothetical protein